MHNGGVLLVMIGRESEVLVGPLHAQEREGSQHSGGCSATGGGCREGVVVVARLLGVHCID
jgi:hypothetical protein